MNIIEPKVELFFKGDKSDVEFIAKCARVCYGREKGNDEITINNLLHNKHYSMFRHQTIYLKIPSKLYIRFYNDYLYITLSPYVNTLIHSDYAYIVTNGNYIIDLTKDDDYLSHTIHSIVNKYRISESEALTIPDIAQHLFRYTIKLTTQISTSRELNRVSPNNISERSTRYVYEDGTLCKPWWLLDFSVAQYVNGAYTIIKRGKQYGGNALDYVQSCSQQFDVYKRLIDNGMSREDARGVLPLDTATECVYTYSVDEWRHIIDLRYFGVTGKPHPNAKHIIGLVKQLLENLGVEFNNK